MLFDFKRSGKRKGESSFAASCVGICLFFLAQCVDYDDRDGLNLVSIPFGWNISRATNQQVSSMITERTIKSYGVSHGQILVISTDGRWYSLSYHDNQDVVRQLGGQGIRYRYFFDRWY